ncbi:MAG: hypothetical protein HY595_00065 [Candidatus Omnitrophica bacterium]|nr:hypothetical protein [Candidatus Omnitrophota bacterium]
MDLISVTSGVILHVALGRWVSSPWLVPDLTLVGLVLALVRVLRQAQDPERSRGRGKPRMVSGVESRRTVFVASLLAAALTFHHPFQAAAAYGALGWGIKTLLSRVWSPAVGWQPPSAEGGKAARGVLPLITIGVAEALLLLVLGAPFVLAVMRWMVTCACGWLVAQMTQIPRNTPQIPQINCFCGICVICGVVLLSVLSV